MKRRRLAVGPVVPLPLLNYNTEQNRGGLPVKLSHPKRRRKVKLPSPLLYNNIEQAFFQLPSIGMFPEACLLGFSFLRERPCWESGNPIYTNRYSMTGFLVS
ncbi:hypothetical protein ES703_97702 [subsurface metagenome]